MTVRYEMTDPGGAPLPSLEVDADVQLRVYVQDCRATPTGVKRTFLDVSYQADRMSATGDVINNGTSGGVGMGTAVRGEQRFLQPGETVTATIEGIGTLTLPVVGEEQPEGLTGAELPPVDSYRDPL